MPRPSRAARTLSSSRGPRPVTPTTGMPASQAASSAARVRGLTSPAESSSVPSRSVATSFGRQAPRSPSSTTESAPCEDAVGLERLRWPRGHAGGTAAASVIPGVSSSTPPSHGRSAFGTYTEPSARWCTSSRQAMVRAIAQSVPLRVAAGWGLPSSSR